jgi:hypothetical protein
MWRLVKKYGLTILWNLLQLAISQHDHQTTQEQIRAIGDHASRPESAYDVLVIVLRLADLGRLVVSLF